MDASFCVLKKQKSAGRKSTRIFTPTLNIIEPEKVNQKALRRLLRRAFIIGINYKVVVQIRFPYNSSKVEVSLVNAGASIALVKSSSSWIED